MGAKEAVEELRDLYEATVGAQLPYPAGTLEQEIERVLRELEPERKLRELFQAVLEEARVAKIVFDDVSMLRRIVLRERIELRRVIRHVLGISDTGAVDRGRKDEELIEQWERHLTAELGRVKTTVRAYVSEGRSFCGFIEPRGIHLKDVARDDLIAYKEAAIRSGLRSSAINNKLGSLRSLYNFLIEIGELEKNPLHFVRRLKEERRALPVLTVEEIEAILGAIDTESITGLRDYALIVLFCATGARVGEVIRLQVQDIDFGRNVVTFRNRKNHNDAEVVLTDNAQAVIKRYIEKVRPKLVAKTKNPAWRDLFVLSSRGRPLHRGSVSNLIALTARKAGVKKHVSPHCFRRSIGTALANNGMPAELLKVFLGHKSINTTLNHYVFYAEESQRRAVEDFHPMALGKLLPVPGQGDPGKASRVKRWRRAPGKPTAPPGDPINGV